MNYRPTTKLVGLGVEIITSALSFNSPVFQPPIYINRSQNINRNSRVSENFVNEAARLQAAIRRHTWGVWIPCFNLVSALLHCELAMSRASSGSILSFTMPTRSTPTSSSEILT